VSCRKQCCITPGISLTDYDTISNGTAKLPHQRQTILMHSELKKSAFCNIEYRTFFSQGGVYTPYTPCMSTPLTVSIHKLSWPLASLVSVLTLLSWSCKFCLISSQYFLHTLLSAIVMVCVVRLSVYHIRISPKISEIDVWLLGNSNRNLGFPIQNLPSDSRSEVRFRHFGCFRVGTSPIQTEMEQLAY